MQDNTFHSIVLSVLYLIIKDKNILSLDDFNNSEEKIMDEVFEFIRNEKYFIHLPDKKLYLKKIFDEFKEKIFINNLLCESNFLNILIKLTAEFDKAKKFEIFEIILKQAISDKVISSGEKEVIYQIAHKLELPIDDLKKYVQSKSKQLSKKKKDDYIKVSKSPMIMLVLAIIFICVASFFAFSIYNYKTNLSAKNINMSNIVYKKIYFDKFIVAGNAYAGDIDENTSQTVQKWFGKTVVYCLEGSADIEFNLNDFKLVDNNKLIYKGKAPERATEVYPFLIDVNVSQSKIKKVFEQEPHEVTPKEAKKPAKVVGLVSGIAGGYIGAKVGGFTGKFIPIGGNPVIGNILGMVAGGAFGAVGAGGAGYIGTKKLLTGIQLTKNISEGDKVKILSKSKEIIAAELFSNEKLMNSLKKDFEVYVKNYFNRFGIKVEQISYAVNIN